MTNVLWSPHPLSVSLIGQQSNWGEHDDRGIEIESIFESKRVV